MTELYVDYHLLHKKGDESLEVALENLAGQGVTELRILSVFMTAGFEFSKMKARVLAYRHQFKKIRFSDPVLKGRRRISSFAAFLVDEYALEHGRRYLFVGHGLPGSKNREYFQLEKALKKRGYGNAKVAMLMGKTGGFVPETEHEQVTVLPLLISGGKHITQDIFGESDSFCTDLESRGFEVEKRIVSLDMSERFRKEFLK